MTQNVFANNASTTLGSNVGPSDTTITVAAGTGATFPSLGAGQYFTATLWGAGSTTGLPNEIVRVTARVGDTMTVVRGQEGTTAQSWGVGDTFANYPTAAFYNNLLTSADLQIQAGNYAVDTGTINAGVLTLSPVPSSLASLTGTPIRFKKTGTNNGSYTLNVNSLGATSVRLNGQVIQSSQLLNGNIYEVVYDGANFELLSNPALIYNNMLTAMSTLTFKGNVTGGDAQPSDVPISALSSLLGIPTIGPYSLGSSGYYVLPRTVGDSTPPLILQWRAVTIASPGSSVSFNWPIPFPNAIFSANPGGQFGLSYSGSYSPYFSSINVNGGVAWGNNGGGTGSTVAAWALGN